MKVNITVGLLLFYLFIASGISGQQINTPHAQNPIPSDIKFQDKNSLDQDDMCIWIHPGDASQSLIISSDKDAGKVFVYDLRGNTLQTIPNPKPGNIDVRYKFPFNGKTVDIAAFNQRKDGLHNPDDPGYRIMVYIVNPDTRQLTRIDDGSIKTGKPNGGTLYHSRLTEKFYFFMTSEKLNGRIEQIELFENDKGSVSGKKVRSWELGGCEGVVADDENGVLFISQEDIGVWMVDAEPDADTTCQLIAKIGDNGLMDDVEGLALYKFSEKGGYLIVSSQSRHRFFIYNRDGQHEYVGSFAIQDVMETDGIEVTNVNLGDLYPSGFFLCHTDPEPSPVIGVAWDKIAKAINLRIDTIRNPRQ